MIEATADLNPQLQVSSFITKLYGPSEGYVYCPVTAPGDAADWAPYFFKYPEDLDELANHVVTKRSERDVYFSPTLFKKPDLRRECVLGSRFLWAEFNGELPQDKAMERMPVPSLKVRTSIPGHEVWFWELAYFSKDVPLLEETLKRIAFHLDADLSSWHYESVLRFPWTVNHRHSMGTVLMDRTDMIHKIEDFTRLPDPPKYLNEDAFSSIPPKDEVLLKYSFPTEVIKFYRKRDPLSGKSEDEKSRKTLHSAYLRLAFDLAEMNMEDREMLSVLLDVDRRWGLWSDRTREAQRGRIIGLINFVRKKKPYTTPSVIEDYTEALFSYDAFMARDFQFDWFIENLIERAGLGVIVADSETGKTRFTISMAMHLAMGRDFLIWKTKKPVRIMFCSLEQTGGALQLTMQSLSLDLLKPTEEENRLLRENFSIFAFGSSLHLDKKEYQERFTTFVEEVNPEVIIIDTLGVAVQDDIENAKIVNGVFEYLASKIRKKLDIAVLFVHHNRKHSDKKATNDDMFGSVYIRNQMSMAIILERMLPKTIMKLRVRNGKNRLAIPFNDFQCLGHRDSAFYEILGDGGVTASSKVKYEAPKDDFQFVDEEDMF